MSEIRVVHIQHEFHTCMSMIRFWLFSGHKMCGSKGNPQLLDSIFLQKRWDFDKKCLICIKENKSTFLIKTRIWSKKNLTKKICLNTPKCNIQTRQEFSTSSFFLRFNFYSKLLKWFQINAYNNRFIFSWEKIFAYLW